jgi:hypothetical protein
MNIALHPGGFAPPPLTPPHKREGDSVASAFAKTVNVWQGTALQQSSPPPCGEGLGVGVTCRP